jgi:hypothetical protein
MFKAALDLKPEYEQLSKTFKFLIFKTLKIFRFFSVLYSTLLYLPPLRIYCVGGFWDRNQDSCYTSALAVRPLG